MDKNLNGIELSEYWDTLQRFEEKIAAATDTYNCAGIYGIYAEKADSGFSHLLYIGKSTNIQHRIASHYTNMVCELSKEYSRCFYRSLREVAQLGYHLQAKLIERQSNKSLDVMESTYHFQYMPPFCQKLNNSINNTEGGPCDIHNPQYLFDQENYTTLGAYMRKKEEEFNGEKNRIDCETD